MKILAIIPARGGSKGIKGKNIVPILGKPLIAYTIECCLRSKLINRVIVSTDDVKIAAIARRCGAEVPFMRPKKFAQDLSPDIDVFYHALRWLKKNEGYLPDIVLNMRPVCPVREVKVVDKAIQAFIDNPRADSLRSVVFARATPYKMWAQRGRFMVPLLECGNKKEAYNMPRQSLPKVLYQHGYVDMCRSRVILNNKCMSGQAIMPFFCENPVDIDYPEDLILAERLLRKK